MHLGSVTLTWHGLMIAVGIAVGGWLAVRYARERGLEPEALVSAVVVLALAGHGGRAQILYLVLNDAGTRDSPSAPRCP